MKRCDCRSRVSWEDPAILVEPTLSVMISIVIDFCIFFDHSIVSFFKSDTSVKSEDESIMSNDQESISQSLVERFNKLSRTPSFAAQKAVTFRYDYSINCGFKIVMQFLFLARQIFQGS